ncbi:QCR2-like protein [Mya arenaria]|uniref:QCR2-like protein n=1 Tax=Mya arenaria TaxID=6604 RepID=A0ABY7DHA4_MYAAR|nr:QCR2-like protein [Mya arenaria]
MATPISRAICNSVKTRFGVRNYGAVSPAVNTANRAKVAETTAKDWKIIQNLDDSQLTRVVVAVRAGSRHEKLMENLHSAAYRDTLGNPLYASRNFIGSFTKEQTSEFIQNHYSNNRVAIVTSGVDEELYQSLTGCLDGFPHYAYNRKGAKSNDEKARYTGGEAREEKPDLDATYVAVATEGPKCGTAGRKVAKQLSAGKFTMSSIGNLAGVPYLDELKDLN